MTTTKHFAGVAALCLSLAACSYSPVSLSESAAERAARIAQSSIVVDTHVDVPYRLLNLPADISQALDSGDFDYPRATAGGLNAPFMSIYTAAELEESGGSFELAEELIDLVLGFEAKWPDRFAVALSPADVRRHFEQGLISLPMGMENGSPLEGKIENIEYFYGRGIRYITLAHSLANHLSDSSYDDSRRWQGLSEMGVRAVAEMNRLGIIVDVSHVSDDAFWQIIELTKAPAIASHSSARHFTPGMERNMSDEMIAALARNGGAICINFGSYFLSDQAREYSEKRGEARKSFALEHADLSQTELYKKHNALYAEENGPFPYASLDDVLDHIDHAVSIAGVEHVCLGSDFDGVGDSLPIGLKDVSDYPNLIEGLLERDYSETDIRNILGENVLRIWQAVEDYAAASRRTNQ